MKYYAVTNDPAELMHYGVKGMKWGVIRTDAQLGHPKKPRSAAYKRASNKLSKMMRSGIKKAEAHWQEYNSPANKKARAKEREAKQFEKYMQQAREGRLKYGKLSDAQVKKVTDRLFLERQARQLGGMEKSNFRRRLGEAVGAGVISGVGQGVSTIVGEAIGRRSRMKTQRLMNEQQEAFDRRRERNNNSEQNLRRAAENAVNKEFYEAVAKGDIDSRYSHVPITQKQRAKLLKAHKDAEKESARKEKEAEENRARAARLEEARAMNFNRSSNEFYWKNVAIAPSKSQNNMSTVYTTKQDVQRAAEQRKATPQRTLASEQQATERRRRQSRTRQIRRRSFRN